MAERDAADAALWYGRQGGLQLGERFLADVERALDTLRTFPASGSTRHAALLSSLPAPLRFIPLDTFGRHVIYYMDMPDHVEVIRVWDASRGLAALMEASA